MSISSKNIWYNFRESVLPYDVPFPVKAFLLLFYLSVFTVGIDLSKEMAKGEFEFFSEVLDETNIIDPLSYLDHLKTDPPLIGKVSVFIQFTEDNDLTSLPHTRAPPQSV